MRLFRQAMPLRGAIVILFWVAPVGAATYTAASCSRNDVEAVINGPTHAAVDGDVIMIPAGSCNWTAGVIVPSGIGISIIGAGQGATVITDNIANRISMFYFQPTYGNSLSRVSSMTLTAAAGLAPASLGPPLMFGGSCTPSGCPNIRVDHITFPPAWSGIANPAASMIITDDVFGVIDHNTVNANPVVYPGIELVNINYSSWQGVGQFGDNSMSAPGTFGTAQAMYVEDNLFSGNVDAFETEGSVSYERTGGARAVGRFNTFTNAWGFGGFSNHGTETDGRPRSSRQFEVYGNTIQNANTATGMGAISGFRGGVNYQFGNTITNLPGAWLHTYLNFATERTYRPTVWGFCDGFSPYDVNDGAMTAWSGSVASVSGNVISLSGSPLTAAAFNFSPSSPGSKYYVLWDSMTGEIAGISSNTGSTVTVGWKQSSLAGGSSVNTGDTVKIFGSTLYAAGTMTGTSGSDTLTDGTKNWTANQWYVPGNAYSVLDVTQGYANQIYANSSNTITDPARFPSWYWNNGDEYVILRAAKCFDSVSYSGGSLMSGNPPAPLTTFESSDPSYEFADTGAVPSDGSFVASDNLNIIADRDYYAEVSASAQTSPTSPFNGTSGTGYGTLANRPATCTPRVGYWATDQGSWNQSGNGFGQGQLFVCTGPNTWTSYYTPYTYPHPLVSATTAPPPPPVTPWSGILSPSRAIDWSKAGLPPIFPDGETTPNPWTPPARTQCGATLSPQGGGQNDTPQMSAALSACAPGHYVLLGPGTFTIGTSLYLSPGHLNGRNNVTLRGSGPMQTTLQVNGNNVFINIGASSGANGGLLTSDSANFTQGVTSVKVSAVAGAGSLVPNNAGVFTQCDTGYQAQTAGQPIHWANNPCVGSHVDNGGLFICGLDPACDTNSGSASAASPQHQIQVVHVTSVNNNGDGTYTVGFNPGLYMPNWTAAQSATLQWNDVQYTAVGDGLENFTIRYQDGNNQYIGLGGIATWVKGVRMMGRSANSDFYVGCSQCLVANNYIVPGSATSSVFGNGINNSNDSDSLIVNNIVQGGLTDDNGGSHENAVFAYNYGRDVTTAYYQPAVFEHAAGSALTLKEGNQVGSMLDDDTWGTHTLNTWFRNYLSCADPPYDINTNGVGLLIDAYARFDNAVGNAIGGSGKCPNYETTTGNTGAVFAFGAGADTLNKLSSLRWGNCDTVTGSCRFQSSEVPTTLSGNAAPFVNPVPATNSLPISFFLGSASPSWWDVCTSWNTFPTSCAATQSQPFPPVGPDVTGGPYVNGHAYDIPAALAFKTLPIDASFQNSYAITGSNWSSGIETLNVSGLPSTGHIMGGFELVGAAAACNPSGGELFMTGSSANTIRYALASNPNASCAGTVKWPDFRQFDEAVYRIGSGGTGPGADTTPPASPKGLRRR